MRELESILPDLAPPGGGLARLQRSVEARQSARRRHLSGWIPLTVSVCALALLTPTWLPGFVAQHQRSAALSHVLQHAVAPSLQPDGIRVIDGAALELPSAQANVRVYLVQTRVSPPHNASAPH